MSFESLALKYNDGRLELLDQRLLPHKEVWVDASHPEAMVSCIQSLQVRGAPLIGVAAVLSLASFAVKGGSEPEFREWAEKLRLSRPTAVNLMNCLDRMLNFETYVPEQIEQVAKELFIEDVRLCERIADNGAQFFESGDRILTHCNTGGLATAGVGTALGVIAKLKEQGKSIHIYVDETRPLLQGGRLTAWELDRLEIPYTLICDNMAAQLMANGEINKAIVGADRIALNGDFANKIGTYSVAVNCHYHAIPFYIAAPTTTIDFDCETGKQIPIEQRKENEVRGVSGSFGEVIWAPKESSVSNPAFDVTPAKLVSAWIFDTKNYSQEEMMEKGIQKES